MAKEATLTRNWIRYQAATLGTLVREIWIS